VEAFDLLLLKSVRAFNHTLDRLKPLFILSVWFETGIGAHVYELSETVETKGCGLAGILGNERGIKLERHFPCCTNSGQTF
jgi:hypothetical protein